MLVRILDELRKEAVGTKFEARYAVGVVHGEAVWEARARAYIHLYLKVMFGVRAFSEREHLVTDGGRDGGIDGYYIDRQARRVYIIQSKFRNTEANFENKPIQAEELLAMQVRRVLGGEEFDDQGVEYNGKIKGMQRALREVYDIGRYTYVVVIIANIKQVAEEKILRLTDSTAFEVIDYSRCYKELLFPVLSGTLFRAEGLGITVDLSNKSTGSKIGYSVSAEDIECEITVVYVPTLEIGRIVSEFKNSVLVYNPRSYLEFEGEKVNGAIRASILNKTGNDFALLNNGVTIICDESSVNDRSGRKGKAQLFLLNPQIINGGQTAYTLSRIYDETDPNERERVFGTKEVLVKAIAVPTEGVDYGYDVKRRKLIENISLATNSQTAVTTADRTSGDPLNLQLQERLFERYGILYERKRGEFADGVRNGYLKSEEIVSRTRFARIYLAANGDLGRSLKKRVTIHHLGREVASDEAKLEKAIIARGAFDRLTRGKKVQSQKSYVAVLPQVRAAVIAAALFGPHLEESGSAAADAVQKVWPDFLLFATERKSGHVARVSSPGSNRVRLILKPGGGNVGGELDQLMLEFFGNVSRVLAVPVERIDLVDHDVDAALQDEGTCFEPDGAQATEPAATSARTA